MERRRVFLHSTFNIEHSTFNICLPLKTRGERPEEPLAPEVTSKTISAECDDENERGQCADTDPDPFLASQAGSLHLIDVLRELMEVLRRELGQTLVHLLLGEAAVRQHLGHLVVRGDVAHERQIGGALVDALIGRGLRRDRTGERGHGRKREDKEKRNELRRTLGHDKYLHVVWCGV